MDSYHCLFREQILGLYCGVSHEYHSVVRNKKSYFNINLSNYIIKLT